MNNDYSIDALRNQDGTYRPATEKLIKGALNCRHTAHLQTEHGIVAFRPYKIDEIRVHPKTGEQFFPGEKVGENWLVEFYPPNHNHADAIRFYTNSVTDALAFAYQHLNNKPHKFNVGDFTQYFSNQANRDATVLAVIDDEVLIEYEMPGTTGQWGYNRRTGEYYHPATPTSALVLCQGSANTLKSIRTYPHKKLPKRWIAALIDQGIGDWIGMGQRCNEPVPFPVRSA